MKRLLINPNLSDINEYLALTDKYGMGFEYNEFYMPDTLDDEKKVKSIMAEYKGYRLPQYHSNTVHRCFRCDFTPYSTLPYHIHRISQASVICLAPLHFPRRSTRPVSYYALF